MSDGDPARWYEIRFRGDDGPLPKFYTFAAAESAAWLVWDKGERKCNVEIIEVDETTRLHVYTVPPSEEWRA